MISFLDTLEEFRDLALEEWNFRKLVQEHLEKLLEQQRVYWKQRGQIKWATFGEENTKFFYASATIRHNKNSILSLKDKDGLDRFSHEEKAGIIWEAFKDRLGSSVFSEIHFDLNELLQPVSDLEELHSPFSNEEIDSIVMNLPLGKSPDPDGFNTNFMKKMLEGHCTRFL
jgi:hypothetical protein